MPFHIKLTLNIKIVTKKKKRNNCKKKRNIFFSINFLFKYNEVYIYFFVNGGIYIFCQQHKAREINNNEGCIFITEL